MKTPQSRGSRHLARMVVERRQTLGFSRLQVVRLVSEKEDDPGYHFGEKFLRQLEQAETFPRTPQLLALARALRMDEFALFSAPRLDAYDTARPESCDFETLKQLGRETFERGDFGSSFAAYDKASEVAASLRDRLHAQTNAATAVKHLGYLALARWCYEQVIAEIEADPPTRVTAYINLADMADMSGNLDMGLAYAERAERLIDPVRDPECLATLLNNKGNLLVNMYELHSEHPHEWLEEGRGYYEKALDAARNVQSLRFESVSLANLGRANCLGGQVKDGLAQLDEALDLACRCGDAWILSAVEAETGKAYLKAGDIDTARGHLAKGLKVAQEGEYAEWVVFCCVLLIEIDRPARSPISFFKQLIDRYRGQVERSIPELVRYEREKADGKES